MGGEFVNETARGGFRGEEVMGRISDKERDLPHSAGRKMWRATTGPTDDGIYVVNDKEKKPAVKFLTAMIAVDMNGIQFVREMCGLLTLVAQGHEGQETILGAGERRPSG